MSTESHVIVVGAGWYGIAAAKTYLQINPSVTLTVIDDSPSIGGVWNKSRIYPLLYANQPTPGLEDWSDITGEDVSKYLELYAAKFGVTERCRFNTRVHKIRRDVEGKWIVSVKPTDQPEANTEELACSKLVIATGFTSVPKMPRDFGLEKYTGNAFHVKELAKRCEAILADASIETVTVVGGSKSAWEAAGLFALGGKKVKWLIREEGMGPAPMSNSRPDGKEHMMKGKNIRGLAGLSLSPFYPERWITKFLYGGGNFIGRWFSANFWKIPLKADMAKLQASPNRRKMMPLSDSLFWLPAGFSSSHPHDEKIWEAIDDGENLSVMRTAIVSAADRTLTLKDGTSLSSDVLILATGWKSPWADLFSVELAEELELPVPLDAESTEHKDHWASLEATAKEQVQKLHPFITKPPAHFPLHYISKRNTTLTHHFRNIVPPSLAAAGNRNIVFLGYLHTSMQAIHAQACSIWSYAYMEDFLPPKDKAPLAMLLKNQTDMEKNTAWMTMWFLTRYLGLFDGIFLATFESRELVDRILLDLGIRPDRKGMLVKNGWFYGSRHFFAEWLSSYGSSEYAGILDEYLDLMKSEQES